MLDFMIIGLPRSGTTWAANLLTTDAVLCHPWRVQERQGVRDHS